jgi:UDP-3-O-[3-hydroxymyristoyl] N-acetylglucosamine deacetylase
LLQSTLKSSVTFEGIGIHTGNYCRISVSPAEEDAGIVFLKGKDKIEATFNNVSATMMCTKLSNVNGISITTIEHLSATLYGLGITNALITIENNEIPVLDGSALPFVKAFLSSGTMKQKKKFRVLRVLKPVKIQEGVKWTSLSPADSLTINVECDFSARGLEADHYSFDFSNDDFINEISPARTFGFLADAEFLKENHLALGASLDNTIVFDEKGCSINKDGLRFPNEPIRHKILDIIGDLSLSQCDLRTRFDSFCPSHKMNNTILRALFEKNDNYEILE